MRPTPLLCALLLCATTLHAAEHWPQFRGPHGTGRADSANPPTHFGPEENVLWKTPVPSGHSSPCVWGDRLFLTAFDGAHLQTLCMEAASGKILWKADAPSERVEPTHRIASPASPTPATDGEFVYSYFGSFGLVAHDFSGREQWRLPLKSPVVEFGTSASPVLADGRLYLACDSDEGSFLTALDPRTGRTLWRTERPEFRRSFATPVLWKHSSRTELIVPGSIWLKSYDPANGRELWTYSGTSRVACSSPAIDGEMLLSASWNVGGDDDSRVSMEPFNTLLSTLQKPADTVLTKNDLPKGPVADRFSQMDLNKDGLITREEWEGMRSMFARAGNALLALRPGGSGDINTSHLAWKSTRSLPYVASPLAMDGRVFTIKNGGLASCYRTTDGTPLFQDQRIDAPGDYYASLVGANGRVYITSQRGILHVLAASDQLQILNRIDLKEPVFATPALVGDVLFLRTEGHLYAFREPR